MRRCQEQATLTVTDDLLFIPPKEKLYSCYKVLRLEQFNNSRTRTFAALQSRRVEIYGQYASDGCGDDLALLHRAIYVVVAVARRRTREARGHPHSTLVIRRVVRVCHAVDRVFLLTHYGGRCTLLALSSAHLASWSTATSASATSFLVMLLFIASRPWCLFRCPSPGSFETRCGGSWRYTWRRRTYYSS